MNVDLSRLKDSSVPEAISPIAFAPSPEVAPMIAVFFAVPALLLLVAVAAVAASWRATGTEIDRLFASLPPVRTASPVERPVAYSVR
jgi:hypothetical protein